MSIAREDGSGNRVEGLLLDLLMAVMDSLEVWKGAAGDRRRGLEWRDRVTARMTALGRYEPYETVVRRAASAMGLPAGASEELLQRWAEMDPWPDTSAIAATALPYGFVTNCSTALSRIAARRSGLRPRFTLSAEEAGWFKPSGHIYLEAWRRLGTTLERTAFIAGSPYDAAGAQAAGLQAWQVLRREDQRPALASARVATSLPDVLARIGRAYSYS
jgi:HAD superfamily hydrolase (TIGR01493 family)